MTAHVEAGRMEEDTLAALSDLLSAERLRHTLGVRDTVLDLHKAWGLDCSDRDFLIQAALLHDFAKDMGRKKLLKASRKGWITFGTELVDSPSLMHAPLSAAYAEHRFGLHDPRALVAIAYHPTGHPDFDFLGLALFLADYLEPTRAFENKRERLLSLAREKPYQATLEVVSDKFHYVRLKGREIHPVALAFEQSVRWHLGWR
ncbi:MAG: bis(5'-nucleosyl)-tetraphosphatase (symmetrical) YqeK [bacterium]